MIYNTLSPREKKNEGNIPQYKKIFLFCYKRGKPEDIELNIEFYSPFFFFLRPFLYYSFFPLKTRYDMALMIRYNHIKCKENLFLIYI